jgi:LPS-assembly lipoprotein
MERRSLLWALAAPLLAGSCGFQLRGAPALPFKRITLQGFAPRSPFGEELRRSFGDAVQVVDTPARAEVVLHVLTDRREKSTVASTAAGQVREVQLRVRFEFRLTQPNGRELIPATAMMLSRDMSTSETTALAKMQEEDQLYAAMQSDIVMQVMRRLSRTQIG